MPVTISMLVAVDIFNSFLVMFTGSIKSGLINLDENYFHDLLNFPLLFFPFIDNMLNVELIFFYAFLFFFCGYQSITYFYIL